MSTLEILIALSIFTLSITAVVMLAFGNQSAIIDTETQSTALSLAQEMIEGERALARQDFKLVNPTTTTAIAEPLTYTASVAVSQLDFYTKQATSTVMWKSGGRSLNVSLSTLFTNPHLSDDGDTCSSVVTGDWSHPQVLNPTGIIDLDVTTQATGLAVENGMVYLTGDSSTKSENDLYVVDASIPAAPTLRASTSTGPGLAAIVVAGAYAYLANTSVTGQLQIIDIHDPFHLLLTANKKIVGAGGVGNTIFFHDHMVYLGLTKNGNGPEFNIIDVHNPMAPVWKGGYTVGNDVNAIYVRNGYAYLATPNNEKLMILDVTDPTVPFRVGGSGVLPDVTANGKSVMVIGNTAYLGRTVGLSPSTKQFYIFDATNPVASPLTVRGSQKISSSINAFVVRSDNAFVATNVQFQVWHIASDFMMTLLGSVIFPTASSGMDCEGNNLFISTLGVSGAPRHDVLKIIGPP